ncbi:MAG: helix-hairpin-helix domain-containing protein [Proteobacteria bacterium]|nr:helix-hairpin-helix domain-containing protein [Pseudomonadota bacterium]
MASAVSVSAGENASKQMTININTATVSELTHLPGIGASKAQAIVKHREKHVFKKIEDIMRVKGIGRKSFKKLHPYLAVKGTSTVMRKKGAAN